VCPASKEPWHTLFSCWVIGEERECGDGREKTPGKKAIKKVEFKLSYRKSKKPFFNS
jgi:hypothetical protein